MVRTCSYLQTKFEVFWAYFRWTKFCKKVQVRQPQVPPTLLPLVSFPMSVPLFLKKKKPLSCPFLEVYFLAHFSKLTEHILHPVLSLGIYSSSWEKVTEMELHHLHYVQHVYTSENTSGDQVQSFIDSITCSSV